MAFAADLLKAGLPLSTELILKFPSPLALIRRYIEHSHPYITTAGEILDAIRANKPHSRKWKVRLGEIILKGGKLSVKMRHGE